MHFILSLIIAAIEIGILPANLSCKEQPRVLRSPTLVSPDGNRRAYVEVLSVTIAVPDENEYPFNGDGLCSNTAILHLSDSKSLPFRPAFVAEPSLGAEEANLTLVDWSADGRYLFGIVTRVGMVGCPVEEKREEWLGPPIGRPCQLPGREADLDRRSKAGRFGTDSAGRPKFRSSRFGGGLRADC